MGARVPAPPHTAHKCPDPWTLIDAMDGAAPLPLGLDGDVEVLEVVIVLRPRTRPTNMVVRINAHDVLCPSDLLIPTAPVRRTL
jgi:hypothetical protein